MGINQRTLIIRIIKTSLGITFVIAIYFLVRIFVCDIFPVSTQSMYPTIKPGERIVVNKLIFGARIYKNLKFINENTFQVWRMPGMREIRNNDIVVFNYPFGGNAIHGINFKIDLVYVKRCIGLPGDSLMIQNGFYRLLSTGDTLGHIANQLIYASTPDSLIIPEVLNSTIFDNGYKHWTTKNLGPIYIPYKGFNMIIDTTNYLPYRFIIEYETRQKLQKRFGKIYLGNSVLNQYTFKENYYFMAGDNVANSHDSRYFGYVPETFIIGVASKILPSH